MPEVFTQEQLELLVGHLLVKIQELTARIEASEMAMKAYVDEQLRGVTNNATGGNGE